MQFRETIKEDVDYIADHTMSRGILKKLPERTDFCYTLEHDEKPLMIGGFQFINLETSWCWVDLSYEAGNHIHTAYRVINEWIDKFTSNHNIKRLQAYARTDFPEAIRLLEHLEFKKESLMKNFIGENDAYLYVRIF